MANCIVRVTRPVLTEEESRKRMEEFKRATAEFLMAVERERNEKKAAEKAG